ncbi:L,D-transpeptidase family protein [Methylophaga sp. OBS4]|uniref:L,D-transpeptidase family protein n=1 Tax=Methylophaga sp. OBS4 TaxID=2991935 RepID=UPI00224DC196|nr:L,D-transpeptidase family protein [Methylophaga sp. OBS4]MCX4188195.1 L,D-transpeptidase family protein [Methylophaga sp. OBS4]
MKARISLVLIVFVMSLFSSQQLFAQSAVLPSPDHPQLAAFLQQQPDYIWLEQQQLTRQAQDALSFITASAIHGLDPDDYHLSLLQQLLPLQNEEIARYFDTLLTDALLHLIHDLAIGRLDPAVVDPDWFIARDQINEADILQQALLAPYLKNALNELIPQLPQYHQLTTALAQYQRYVDRGGWQTIPATPLLRPGDKHAYIPLIRARLAVEETVLSQQDNAQNPQYDNILVDAVTRFQKRHGLKVDGIIGSETLHTLNIAAEDLVRRIKLNLERLRWLPNDLGRRYLLVNLGSYQLTAINEAETVLDMRVIVGRRVRSTPSFNSAMTHIVFNPYWSVPHKLARLDLLPKQQENPDYFFLHGFRIYLRNTDFQTEVDPYRVDWNSLDSRNFPYRLQQLPGKHNALGQIKFMFPNPWNIYLHDTPHKELFEQSQRNFSSGCIRVEDPLALANFSLNRENAQLWVQEQIVSNKNRGQPLRDPLPVYAVYFTVWPHNNVISFAPDHYQRDQRMVKFL